MATLLSRIVPVAFLEVKLQKMANIGLVLASNVKYYFRFGISAHNSFHEANFIQIGPEIKNSDFSKDTGA